MRHSKAGYTLLETLLALACLALIGIPILTVFGAVSRLESASETVLEQTEFARSLIEEVTVTRSHLSESGLFGDRFAYEIVFTPEPLPQENQFGTALDLYRVSVVVDDISRGGNQFQEDYFIIGPRVE